MRIFILIVAALALLPTSAFAHALGVYYKVQGAKVEVEAYYDEGSAAVKAKVSVINAKDEIIAKGETDKDGKWNFATPKPGKYEIRVDAGAGHRAKKAMIVPGAVPETPAPKKAPGPDAPPPKVEAQPSISEEREEMTRTPWLKIGIGLTVIIVGSGAMTLGLMLRKSGTAAHE